MPLQVNEEGSIILDEGSAYENHFAGTNFICTITIYRLNWKQFRPNHFHLVRQHLQNVCRRLPTVTEFSLSFASAVTLLNHSDTLLLSLKLSKASNTYQWLLPKKKTPKYSYIESIDCLQFIYRMKSFIE